jgi:hypothetical protein
MSEGSSSNNSSTVTSGGAFGAPTAMIRITLMAGAGVGLLCRWDVSGTMTCAGGGGSLGRGKGSGKRCGGVTRACPPAPSARPGGKVWMTEATCAMTGGLSLCGRAGTGGGSTDCGRGG